MVEEHAEVITYDRIYAERVERLFGSEATALLATLINGLILTLVLWDRTDWPRLIGWLATLYLVSGLRFLLSRRYFQIRRDSIQYRRAYNAFVAGAFLSGIIWGAGGVLLFPAHAYAHQVFIAFVLGGMVAGASVAYSSFLLAFNAYSLPALLPLIVRLLTLEDEIHLGMAVMLGVYLILMLVLAMRVRRILMRSFELRYENQDLIQDLQRARQQTERANEELQKHHDQLEATVAERTEALRRTNEELQTTLEEFRRAQQSLSESEEKYRLLVEKANEGIFIAQDGVIKFPNPRTLEISGYSQKELETVSFAELIHPDDRDRVLAYHQARIEGAPSPENYTFMGVNRKTELLWIEISSTLTKWDGRPATLNLIRDVTHQKKLEEQLVHAQKMEAIGTLAGGIAHDFNNLLHAVHGYAELLLMDLESDDERSDKVRKIMRAASRAGELTQQLLAFSRIREAQVQPLDLNETLPGIKVLIEKTLPKAISVRLDLGEGPLTLCVDPDQLEQVLFSLAVNARDAMPNGGELRIGADTLVIQEDADPGLPKLTPGSYVCIEVSDTGQGMDATVRERIFEPFFTTREVGRGSGLGLAMTYGVMQQYGGAVRCESEPGKGSTFRLYFPAFDPLQPAIEAEEHDSVRHGGATILVVDDEPFMRDLGRQVFTRFGYDVLLAENGQQAVEICAQEPSRIDLVVLDLIMPGMNGEQCLEKLLELSPKIKVVIATGFSRRGPSRELLHKGARGILHKPFQISEALRVVHRVLHADDENEPAD